MRMLNDAIKTVAHLKCSYNDFKINAFLGLPSMRLLALFLRRLASLIYFTSLFLIDKTFNISFSTWGRSSDAERWKKRGIMRSLLFMNDEVIIIPCQSF